MMKPGSLRAALTAFLPGLVRNPEKLHIFVEEGHIVATGGRTLSFEYVYTLTVILTDYVGSSDAVMVPVLAWLRENQSELFFNPDRRENGFKFDVDILNHTTVDIAIKLALTERVVVKVVDGKYQIEHQPEPANEHDDPSTWRAAPPTA